MEIIPLSTWFLKCRYHIGQNLSVVLTLIAILFVGLAPNGFAESPFDQGNRLVNVELVSDRSTLQSQLNEKEPVAILGLNFRIERGWHLYWENSGEAGQPTTVNFRLPANWRHSTLQWTVPERFIERGNVITYGYESSAFITTDLFSPEVIPSADQDINIVASVSWLVCKEICVPGFKEVSLNLPFSQTKALERGKHAELFEQSTQVSNQLNRGVVQISTEYIPSSSLVKIKLKAPDKFPAAQLAKLVQLFPREMAKVKVGNPTLTLEETEAVIRIPLAQRAGNKPEYSIFSALLVLAPELSSQGQARLANVDLKLSKSDLEELPKSIIPSGGLPLEYRLVNHSNSENSDTASALSPEQDVTLAFALFIGVIAGIIMNLMPCVLPVLSLKIMSLSLHKEYSLSSRTKHAIAYLLGIEFTFLSLALVVTFLKRLGLKVGWGFEFQHPSFVLTLAIIVLLFALGFFDLYIVRLPGASRLDKELNTVEHPTLRSFGEGILITLLSTPCTAPYLGAPLAFAFTQSGIVTAAVFLAIGFGLALPYLAVAFNQRLAAFIPKPGRWMEELKIFMGFLLLGTVIWLIFILDSLLPGSTPTVLALLLWISFLVWLNDPLDDLKLLHGRRKTRLLLSFLAVAASLYFAGPRILQRVDSHSVSTWPVYTRELEEKLLREGHYIFIDFTADWCISCKFNENFALSSSEISRTFDSLKITALKGDWTDGSKEITDALDRFGSRGVPLYVFLAPDGRKEILPPILTTGTVTSRAKAFVNKDG